MIIGVCLEDDGNYGYIFAIALFGHVDLEEIGLGKMRMIRYVMENTAHTTQIKTTLLHIDDFISFDLAFN